MEIYERIRELRKNKLNLTQTEFGKVLGVSRDVIKNIELNALARPDQKEPLYRLICEKFHVNYDWLINGVGNNPFSEDAPEDEYTRAVTEIDVRDPKARQAIIDYWKSSDIDKELWWNFMDRFLKK